MSISICVTLRNRADLFKYCLESLSRQDYDLSRVEICIADGGSTDNLVTLIDRYSDVFTFKFAYSDRSKSYLPIVSNCPAADINVMVKHMASNEDIIKMDPEIVLKDTSVLQEISDGLLKSDRKRMFNVRCHFTEGDDWYLQYEDILYNYEEHYHYAEGGPFSRSKFYFCSGFSRYHFLQLGGIEELFGLGVGYDDTQLRESWKNRYGEYEHEIFGEGIHLWHGQNQSRPAWEQANGRMYHWLKHATQNNVTRFGPDNKPFPMEKPEWANPEMLSKIYTIKNSKVINVQDINDGNSAELDLPF